MSLVRLLTAGKSLVGLKESESRYRVSRQRLLPRFEAKRNPFGERAKHAAQPEPSAVQESTPPPAQVSPAESVSPHPVAPPKRSMNARVGLLFERCISALRSLMFWRGRRVVPMGRASKRLVQPELSLAGVKVVRNDLTDSDIEVVAPKVGPVAKVSTPATEAAKGPAGSRWMGVADRLLRSGKP